MNIDKTEISLFDSGDIIEINTENRRLVGLGIPFVPEKKVSAVAYFKTFRKEKGGSENVVYVYTRKAGMRGSLKPSPPGKATGFRCSQLSVKRWPRDLREIQNIYCNEGMFRICARMPYQLVEILWSGEGEEGNFPSGRDVGYYFRGEGQKNETHIPLYRAVLENQIPLGEPELIPIERIKNFMVFPEKHYQWIEIQTKIRYDKTSRFSTMPVRSFERIALRR
jgi:hypothetical protein